MDLNLPHRRYNPLTREWVLVSPHRAQRPWLGQVEKAPQENLPDYDPTCYLCPRNVRAGDQRNPDYASTFVFDNDFPALLKPEEAPITNNSTHVSRPALQDSLLIAEPEFGLCRVVCFSPRHDLSLPELSQAEVEAVVRAWIDQTSILADKGFVRYVQVFENKGAMMGASNPHPHSQVWATSHIPNQPARESIAQVEYLSQRASCLLCDTLAAEKETGERLVVTNEHFTALVPFWAVWPFEVLLLSNRHIPALSSLESDEIAGLADIIRRLTARYDNLFEISFPYSMGFHQAPVNGPVHAEWHLHAHYYPPLLRSATVRKFMVGFELLASPQRDLTPEVAAQRLRSSSDRHYRSEI
ncbi:MAG TPA: UDP-glucose--hexose-1-phosphate uridylyltransferase [Anaerolineales bacterium]|nr:UDP-glucose--hexose-1-phosphate uridylyltransferase [Anaerolineales bacterium]